MQKHCKNTCAHTVHIPADISLHAHAGLFGARFWSSGPFLVCACGFGGLKPLNFEGLQPPDPSPEPPKTTNLSQIIGLGYVRGMCGVCAHGSKMKRGGPSRHPQASKMKRGGPSRPREASKMKPSATGSGLVELDPPKMGDPAPPERTWGGWIPPKSRLQPPPGDPTMLCAGMCWRLCVGMCGYMRVCAGMCGPTLAPQLHQFLHTFSAINSRNLVQMGSQRWLLICTSFCIHSQQLLNKSSADREPTLVPHLH